MPLSSFFLLAAAEAGGGGSLVSLQVNLMFWTLVIFGILYWILKKYAFPAVLGAVEAREKALADAIEGAKRDRDEAAALLAEHRAQIENARNEAQKFIAEARVVSEKSRADMLEKTRLEQQEMLERARRDIGVERDKAIMELRREAVDLAIAGASRVVEQNLDSDKNRKLVETFLASLATEKR
ncbi:MAG TPA: F0F1 ATP synthase subunit B [Gemmatimonadaceae bacterium]|nr:F0F1 ATP synthase subunit B [Gemmatimonadaceae bacterium]